MFRAALGESGRRLDLRVHRHTAVEGHALGLMAERVDMRAGMLGAMELAEGAAAHAAAAELVVMAMIQGIGVGRLVRRKLGHVGGARKFQIDGAHILGIDDGHGLAPLCLR